MTKDIKIRIHVEIENNRTMVTKFEIQLDYFGQRMMKIQKRIGSVSYQQSHPKSMWERHQLP